MKIQNLKKTHSGFIHGMMDLLQQLIQRWRRPLQFLFGNYNMLSRSLSSSPNFN